MKALINVAVAKYLKSRRERIDRIRQQPQQLQENVFHYLVRQAVDTEFGRQYGFSSIQYLTDFQHQVPLHNYNSTKPYIERMMMGERSVLWPGEVRFFAKSSGTTEDRSKFLPISRQNIIQCQTRGSWDTMTTFYDQVPDSQLFRYKSILIGGTYEYYEANPRAIIGDISAIMNYNMPPIGRPFRALKEDTYYLADWEEKIEAIAQIGLRTPEVAMMAGVPTWSIAILDRILELSGKDHLLEVWPYFQGFIHGGVNFAPYRKVFERLFPHSTAFQEIYNSTEGYFAVQDDFSQNGMLLLLDNGMFFEFIPLAEFSDLERAKAVPIWEVEPGVIYAMVVSTNSGLWRFIIGDTVEFTSIKPYRIKIKGRTKLFVNAFGEEVIIDNTDRAIAQTCEEFGVSINDYTVAPLYLDTNQRGRHDWFIEFTQLPKDLQQFSQRLDHHLRLLNSDYDTKRFKDLALENLHIYTLPIGTFKNWLAQKGKLGGQNKVPRLSNDRKIAEEITALMEN